VTLGASSVPTHGERMLQFKPASLVMVTFVTVPALRLALTRNAPVARSVLNAASSARGLRK
jgi:hypothetical protein